MKKIVAYLFFIVILFSCKENEQETQINFRFDGLQTYYYNSEYTEEDFEFYAYEEKIEDKDNLPEFITSSNNKDERETYEMFHEFQINNDSIYITIINSKTNEIEFAFNRKIKIENNTILMNIVNFEGKDLGFKKIFDIEVDNILSMSEAKYFEGSRTKSSDGSFEFDTRTIIGKSEIGNINYFDEEFNKSISNIEEEEFFGLFKIKRYFLPE